VSDTATVALTSSGGSASVAITALLLSFRMFNSLMRRIEVIGRDLQDFCRRIDDHDKRISKLEGKS